LVVFGFLVLDLRGLSVLTLYRISKLTDDMKMVGSLYFTVSSQAAIKWDFILVTGTERQLYVVPFVARRILKFYRKF
jgi:hypothetical protein